MEINITEQMSIEANRQNIWKSSTRCNYSLPSLMIDSSLNPNSSSVIKVINNLGDEQKPVDELPVLFSMECKLNLVYFSYKTLI